jgi:hypothetical protein
MMEVRHAAAFVDIKVHVRLKLFAFVVFRNVLLHLWRLFRASPAWKIAGHARWKNAFRMAAIMVIPSLMPFLSLVLPAAVNRWMNIVFGAVYSAIMMVVIRGGWHYYILFGLIEITLTVFIVWYAWTWPKQPTR